MEVELASGGKNTKIGMGCILFVKGLNWKGKAKGKEEVDENGRGI